LFLGVNAVSHSSRTIIDLRAAPTAHAPCARHQKDRGYGPARTRPGCRCHCSLWHESLHSGPVPPLRPLPSWPDRRRERPAICIFLCRDFPGSLVQSPFLTASAPLGRIQLYTKGRLLASTLERASDRRGSLKPNVNAIRGPLHCPLPAPTGAPGLPRTPAQHPPFDICGFCRYNGDCLTETWLTARWRYA
jgi:hypothetical protein